MSQLTLDLLFEKSNKPTRFEINALKENIKICPFCGCNEVCFIEDKHEHITIEVWVRCIECGADSPPSISRLSALKLWNKRIK